MASRSNIMGGSRSNRMSSMVAGDKPRAKSVVSTASGTTNVTAGAPVTNLGAYIKDKKAITDRVPAYAEKLKNIPRSYVPSAPKTLKNIFGGYGVTPLVGVRRFPTKNAPKATVVAKPVVAKPVPAPAAQVIRTTVGERLSPVKAAPPANKAVSARTGNTTGVTTGKTTGSKSFTPGMATKTMQSAYGRQMTNAMNRGNQPAGPMGGGGGRAGGGGSLSGGGSGSRSAGTSRTGGTKQNNPVRG